MKEYMPAIIIAVCALIGLVMLISYIKSGKPFAAFFLHSLGGIGSLLVVNMFSFLSGITLPLNLFSIIGVGVLGIPGTASLLIFNLIFK